MKIERLFNSSLGKIFLSVIIGLGISGLLNKTCKDSDDCIVIKGPSEKNKKHCI